MSTKSFPIKNENGEKLNITINPYTKQCLIHINSPYGEYFHISKKEEVDSIIDILEKFKEEAYGNTSD